MAMRMLTSISTQNTLVVVTHTTSFMAHKYAKFAAFDKFFSMGGNLLSSSKSQATSTIKINNHE